MTPAERADRARRIAQAKASGLTWPQVAEEFGVSEKTARRAAEAHATGVVRLAAEAPVRDLSDIDARGMIALGLHAHEVALRRGLALLVTTEGASAVGAMNAIARVLSSAVTNMSYVGLVGAPSLERFREQMRAVASALLDVSEARGIPPEELLAAFDARLAARISATDRATIGFGVAA